jgi:uncharacterized protein (TIGR02186 family)
MRRAATLLAALVSLWATPPQAEPLVVDLSNHLVPITAGFAGTDVLLFGATDGEGDIVVAVRGPSREVAVRRKGNVLGMWLTVHEIRFRDVPTFYHVASTRPLESFAPEVLRDRHGIGIESLKFETMSGRTAPRVFRDALIRVKQSDELFPTQIGKVTFLGDRLFRTRVFFPSNVPTGTYFVETFLIREGQVIGAQTTPLVVNKVGLGADVFYFAHAESLIYGLVAVVLAAMAGWLVGLVFRRR